MNTGIERSQNEIRRIKGQIAILKEQGFSNFEMIDILKVSRSQFFRYCQAMKPDAEKTLNLDKSIEVKPLTRIQRNLNPIEFCDKYLAVNPLPMQRLILKAFYNLELNDLEKNQLLKLKREGKTTWEYGGKYNELVLLIGMKGGKTTLASIIAQIEEYELFKKGNPAKFYGLVPGERIYIKNVATNEKQAEKTIFAKIQASIDRSPYFKARQPKLTGTIYHFRDTNVYIESGHSNSSSLVGDACILVLLDELDRFVKTGTGKYSAEEVYNALDKSTDPFNRGGHSDGKTVSISSLVHPRGFMVYLYELCKRLKSMLGFWMPEWEMQPDLYSGKTFIYNKIRIPLEHKDALSKNPEKFLRDKAGIIGYSIGAFYREPDKIKNMFENSHNLGYKNPIDELGRFADWFKAKSDIAYFLHHDPSVSHDAYAIVLGHRENDIAIIDMVYRFIPPEAGEIDIEKVKLFCEDLLNRFPSIEKITYDTWAASSIMQFYDKLGFKVENLYIRKPQHELLKEKIYTNKFHCHRYPILERELSELELDGDKIDHPSPGSKDTADAVAGVVWNAMQSSDLSAGLAIGNRDSEVTESGFKILNGKRRRKIWESEHIWRKW